HFRSSLSCVQWRPFMPPMAALGHRRLSAPEKSDARLPARRSREPPSRDVRPRADSLGPPSHAPDGPGALTEKRNGHHPPLRLFLMNILLANLAGVDPRRTRQFVYTVAGGPP